MPETDSSGMAARQNDDRGLRLLLAQRRMYRRGKRWSALSTVGLGIVALVAPIITVAAPSLAVWAGAIAGAWVFLSRTIANRSQRLWVVKAASVQDEFDRYVFNLAPSPAVVSWRPPEEIHEMTEGAANAAIDEEKLRDWYAFDAHWPRNVAVAVLQRQNTVYTGRLLAVGARTWLVLLSCWAALALLVACVRDLSAADALLGIVLPVLPALLDANDERSSLLIAASEREQLARAIEDTLRSGDTSSLDDTTFCAWQDQAFRTRLNTPLVPEWIYASRRRRNEAIMARSNEELVALAQRPKGST